MAESRASLCCRASKSRSRLRNSCVILGYLAQVSECRAASIRSALMRFSAAWQRTLSGVYLA
jgi:hypothetical protein